MKLGSPQAMHCYPGGLEPQEISDEQIAQEEAAWLKVQIAVERKKLWEMEQTYRSMTGEEP